VTRQLVILSPVEAELADAVEWYEAREQGLGHEFIEAFDAAVARIAERPESHQRLSDSEFRQVLLRRFPFVIIYEVRRAEIRIVALAHTSRRPGYWLGR
jgi:plasmid stabilization system protein ParE